MSIDAHIRNMSVHMQGIVEFFVSEFFHKEEFVNLTTLV